MLQDVRREGRRRDHEARRRTTSTTWRAAPRAATATPWRSCSPRSGRARSTSAAACCPTPPTPRTPARRRCSTSPPRSAPGASSGRFTTWLHVVAVNTARSTYRRMKNQAHRRPTSLHAASRPDPRTTSVIAGTRLDLLEAMETIERDHPQYVEPLLLRDVYGLPYEEIATLVGAPLGTVKAQIHHGRKLARPLLRGDVMTRARRALAAPASCCVLAGRRGWPGAAAARRRPRPSSGAGRPRRRLGRAGARAWTRTARDLDAAVSEPRRGQRLPRRRRPGGRRPALRPRPGLGPGRPHAHGRGEHRPSAPTARRRPLPARPRRRRSTVEPSRSTATDVPFAHAGKDLVVTRSGRGRRALRAVSSPTPARPSRSPAPTTRSDFSTTGWHHHATPARPGRCRSRTAPTPGTPSTTSPSDKALYDFTLSRARARGSASPTAR